MRRRDTYLGSGSILRPGKDGLEWTSSDPAESKAAQKPSKRWDNKMPTRAEIERQSAPGLVNARLSLVRS